MVLPFFLLNGVFSRCVNEPLVHGVNPAGSGSGGEVLQIPNELNAGASFPATRDSVNECFVPVRILFSESPIQAPEAQSAFRWPGVHFSILVND